MKKQNRIRKLSARYVLKNKKLDQEATLKFVLKFKKEESLWNVMFKTYKNRNAKNEIFTDCLQRHI